MFRFLFLRMIAPRRPPRQPAPDLVECALRGGNYDKTKVVVIGDHPVDVEMAANAGVRNAVGVLTGLATRESFRSSSCAIVSGLEELAITC